MAELIEKDALSEEIESLTVHVTGLRAGKGVLSKFMDEYRNSVLRIIDDQPTADFPNCVCFGKQAEFAEKYLHQGTKVDVQGRLQTGSYTNKDGVKVYTTDVVLDDIEFAESKTAEHRNGNTGYYGQEPQSDPGDGFMNIPDGIQEELPFN